MSTKSIKPIKFNLKKLERDAKKDRKSHPIKYFIKDGYNVIKNFCENTPKNIKAFIQRGKRGYADCDVWGLDYYLSDVIEHSIKHLKRNKNGHPTELSEGEWVDILNSISYTFLLAKRCSEGDLVLIRDKNNREKFDKTFTDKDMGCRYMSAGELRAYDLGWKNLKKYFANLWD